MKDGFVRWEQVDETERTKGTMVGVMSPRINTNDGTVASAYLELYAKVPTRYSTLKKVASSHLDLNAILLALQFMWQTHHICVGSIVANAQLVSNTYVVFASSYLYYYERVATTS